jgi:hypothetical protein
MLHIKFNVVVGVEGILCVRDGEKMHQVAYGVYNQT